MSEEFTLRSQLFWQSLVWGLTAVFVSALGAFVFIGIMNFGTDLLWPNPPSWEPFSGSWTIVVIMTVAGFFWPHS